MLNISFANEIQFIANYSTVDTIDININVYGHLWSKDGEHPHNLFFQLNFSTWAEGTEIYPHQTIERYRFKEKKSQNGV